MSSRALAPSAPRTLHACLLAGLVLISAFVGIGPAQAQTATAGTAASDRAGTVKLVNGKVTASTGSAERPLVAGDAVFGTDHITTGADSSASLVLRDGTTIVVGPASRLELRGFAFNTTTYQGNLAVMVLRGSMRMVSGLIRKNNPEGVHIETPTAVIGIRGTDFIVDVDPAGEAR